MPNAPIRTSIRLDGLLQTLTAKIQRNYICAAGFPLSQSDVFPSCSVPGLNKASLHHPRSCRPLREYFHMILCLHATMHGTSIVPAHPSLLHVLNTVA
jgi:hypothetical protein